MSLDVSLLDVLAIATLVLAAIPAAMVVVNLPLFRRAAGVGVVDGSLGRSSLLIPARNEAESIGAALEAAQRSEDPNLEILVMDDHSDDATVAIVEEVAVADPRIGLHAAPPLPRGWNGKQHACARLAERATGEVLIFVDADVRLEPGAVDRLCGELERSGADLVSGFPRQLTGSLFERLLIPLVHFVLLGFLPLLGMRWSSRPAFAAACGQLIAVRREAYERAGGHAAIRASRHDGLQLPRAIRRTGGRTDLFDATDLATCRMYGSASEVWNGLAKNATEGMATPGGIVPWTVLLVGGQVVPVGLLLYCFVVAAGSTAMYWAAAATLLGYATRGLLAWRFDQSWLGALLHPIGVALLVAIQWWALLRRLGGASVQWKGRGEIREEEGSRA